MKHIPIKPILPPAIVFIFHALMIIIFDIYTIFPAFDIPMHFLGGLSIGISAIMLIKIFKSKITTPKWFQFIWIVGLAVIAATVWEFAEFGSDYFLHTLMQPSLADTMLDMFLGMIGGCVAGGWFAIKQK
jgi:hypothetical protein